MLARIGTPLRSHLSRVFSVCLLGAVLYSNTLNVPFLFDDLPNIEAQPSVRLKTLSLDGLLQASFRSRLRTRPVANLSFALNYYFGQYRVTGYHLVNLALHLCNGTLVYLLALILFRQQAELREPSRQHPPASAVPAVSLFAAMVFIAHPLQTETVTYIVQRMNSLAVMFFLLAFLFYIRGRRTSRRPVRWALYCGCFVSWMLALGSKEIAAIFPVIVWLYEWYFFGSLSKDWFKRNLRYTLGAAMLFGAVAAAYIGGNPLEGITKDYALRDFTLGERVLTQFRVIIFYIGLVVYPNPSRLNLLHDFSTSRSVFEPITTLFSFVALVSLMGLAIYLARRHRLMSFCVLWFFATLAIESSVIGLEMIFEHRLYLPMVGVAFLASQALFSLTSHRRILRPLIGAVLIATLGTATYLRNRVWQDEITLWSDVVAKNGNSYRAHNNLGTALALAGRLDDAVRHYTEAIRIDPNSASAHNNLGLALQSQRRLQEAAAHLREGLRIDPASAAAHANLGLTLAADGRIEEAKQHFLEALRIDPRSAAAHNNLGLALAQEGRLDQARWHFLQALRIDPTSATAHANLGLTFAAEGRLEEAARQYSTALDIRPEFAAAYNNLGEVRVRQGRLDEAIRHFLAALRIQPDYRKARTNLERASQRLREPPSQRGVANQP